MKKSIIGKISAAAALLLALTFVLPACGKKSGESDGRIPVTISVNNGGYGTEWVSEAAKEFNLKQEDYRIAIKPEKTGPSEIYVNIKANNNADAYFTTSVNFQQGYAEGYFEDLSDILETQLEGENRKIGDKIQNKENWTEAVSYKGEGFYALPYADSLLGFVFDYDMFEENNWLIFAENSPSVKSELTAQGIIFEESGTRLKFVSSSAAVNYDAGDFIASPGRDGKYGTYDDGQPDTLSEWSQMINKITAASKKSFIWTGRYENYCDEIFMGVFAQLVGIDNYLAYINYDSKGKQVTLADGTQTAIDIDSGYLAGSMAGIKETFEFVNTYMNNATYYHPASTQNGTAHKDAQNHYLLGVNGSSGSTPTAMLVEGVWWENEAKTMFNTLYNQGNSDMKYGTRDFRYMFYPHLTGSKGIDGESGGSVICSKDNGGIVVCKSNDTKKVQIAKDFIAFTLSDEWLAKFTVMTGAIRPYSYSLSAEQQSTLTKFSKTVMDIYGDSENVHIIKPQIEFAKTPVRFATSLVEPSDFFPMTLDGVVYKVPLKALRRSGVDTCARQVAAFRTSSVWAGYVSEARTAGYYTAS